jgi:hypothetical protein
MHEGRENQINNLQKFIDVPATSMVGANFFKNRLPITEDLFH